MAERWRSPAYRDKILSVAQSADCRAAMSADAKLNYLGVRLGLPREVWAEFTLARRAGYGVRDSVGIAMRHYEARHARK